MASRLGLPFALLALACGTAAPRLAADGGVAGADGGGGLVAGASYSLEVAGSPLASPGEITFCVVRRLDNDATALVTDIETTLSAGSHHLIVYRSEETQERPTPFECTPFTETLRGQAVPLLISQVRNERLPLPRGVVYELAPRQMVRVEAHYFNGTGQTIQPRASVTFRTVLDAPGLQRADFLFFGTPDIELAPGARAVVGPRFVSAGIPPGAKVYAMTAHTHQWGTQFRVEKARSRADDGGVPIYSYPNWSWDEPPVKTFDPPLTFAEGEGVRFTCEYHNASSRRVSFGESAENEMCFLWMYYYPSSGYRLCVDTDYYNVGELCCPGHFACPYLLGML